MKNQLLVFVLFFCLLITACTSSRVSLSPRGEHNLAYQWGIVAMEATAHDTQKFSPRPTVTSRFLGLMWTAAYDAWSRYDAKAVPVYLTDVERRPKSERTLRNKQEAISYALYNTMMTYYASDAEMITGKMKAFGFDPSNTSLDPASPAGIGNLAANTVIRQRMYDGANQTGDVEGANGNPYADYNNYAPVNSVDSLIDIKHWQPKYFSDGKGGRFAPGCLTPHWGSVKPLMLDAANQFRPGPPPAIGSRKLPDEVLQVVNYQANLTNEQKALVEFMRDGPASVQQAGHWFLLAQVVSKRDHHSLDDDIKMFFAVEAAAMDAFIACWDSKIFYDFARPYALVHYYFKDQRIKGWGGPGKGWGEQMGQEWRPYSPETFLCPAFPSYVSGHSTISAACAEVLRRYTGSDRFDYHVTRIPGELTEPGNTGSAVVLNFPTFTKTADLAGHSRVLGGYHIPTENVEGLKLGRSVGNAVYDKYLQYVNGRR
jgi:hypothetical protein